MLAEEMVNDGCSHNSDLHFAGDIFPNINSQQQHCTEVTFNVILQTSSSAHNASLLSGASNVKHLRFLRHKITKVSCQGMFYLWVLLSVSGFQQVCYYHSGLDVSSMCGNHTADGRKFGIPWPYHLIPIALATLVIVEDKHVPETKRKVLAENSRLLRRK